MYPSADHPQYGIFIKNISDGLKKNNIKIEMITMTKKGSAIDKIMSYLGFYLLVINKIMTKRYAGIYVHYLSHCGAPVLFASLFKKIDIISNAHGGDLVQEDKVSNRKFFLKKKVNQLLLDKSRLVVAPSQYYKSDVIVRQYGVMQEKVFVSPSGGVDEKVFKASDVEMGSKGQPSLLYVGRITEDKGVFDFLSALEKIKDKNCVVDIIGHGEKHMLERLKRNMKAFEDSNVTINYHGSVRHDALPRFYQQANAFVFPSKRFSESLGLVGLEAMACGTPVIGSDIAGISSYLEDGYNGLAFNPHQPGELKKALEEFLELEAKDQKNLSVNALLTAQKYSSEKVLSELAYKIKEELSLS
ncbi:LPS biosynthesis protein RfbU [Kushneria pakistanensis]|uniref:LPS biosynthesis protein RfbU n=2 Tax=Kushneria pakistanensis TaxID=1508770 RepID=A0ABQ3FM01_9GAMM|nr:LPS biosynthesis protein RfbU [Kushneria pakistanensis]